MKDTFPFMVNPSSICWWAFLLLMIHSLTAFQRNAVRSLANGMKVGHAPMSHHAGASSHHKNVLVAVADGTEEIEAVTVIDVLARAGAKVTVASVMNRLKVECSRGVKLEADCLITDALDRNWDMIVCPGGLPGAEHLSASEPLIRLLQRQADEGKSYAAICAAPALVLAKHGLLNGKTATCYPTSKFTSSIDRYVSQRVVDDGNVITSQGPATAMPFSLKLVEELFGSEKAQQIKGDLLA